MADAGSGTQSNARRWSARRVGTWLIVAGAIAMIAGMAVDAVQHSLDATLTEREGLFTLTNGGHALLLGGAGFVITGVVLAIIGPWLYDRPGAGVGRQALQFAVPVALAVVLATTAAWGSNSSLAEGHAHDDSADHAMGDGSGHDHAVDDAAAMGHSDEEHAAMGHDESAEHDHGGVSPFVAPVDVETQRQVMAQMAHVREVTARYPTVADATAAGLKRVGPFAPGSGAHYLIPNPTSAISFDVDNPIIYLYSGNEPTSVVVGVMYFSIADEAPEGFLGPNDAWHQHTGLCLGPSETGDIELPLPIDQDITQQQCDAVSGRFMDVTGWMIHVWSAPGWESPWGVFSHDNPMLVCTDGKTAEEAQLHIGCRGLG
jgi:hypothetical protein